VKTKLIPAMTMAIAICAMIYTGCKKEDDAPTPVSTASTSEKTIGTDEVVAADASFNDVIEMISASSLSDVANTEPNPIMAWKGACATVTANTHVIPHRAVIDFGNGCAGSDGNFRSGKIIILWEGAYTNRGSYFIISFDNYAMNYNKVEGGAKLVNTGYNHAGNLEFQLDANGILSVAPKGAVLASTDSDRRYAAYAKMTYNFHGTREWISGMMTPAWNDDVYMIKGYTTGTNLRNELYKVEITTALRNEVGFPYYTRGMVNLRVNNVLRVIDYGYVNNGRDDLASMVVGDVMTVIHLDKNPFMIANTR
jgi:hypothetical protein